MLNFLNKVQESQRLLKKLQYIGCMSVSHLEKKKENNELKRGDNERRGIVRLRSDCLIAFKNKRAENKLIIIKANPGII